MFVIHVSEDADLLDALLSQLAPCVHIGGILSGASRDDLDAAYALSILDYTRPVSTVLCNTSGEKPVENGWCVPSLPAAALRVAKRIFEWVRDR